MRIYPGTTVDYEFAELGGLGYTGTLNDRQFAALRAEGLTGSLPDMFGQFDGELSTEPTVDELLEEILSDGLNFALDTERVADMWQESTKTTQVSAANDPVGALASRFGMPSYNFLNSTALNRPLWDGTGALICDGSNDSLASTDAFGFLNNAPASFLCAHVYVGALTTTHGVIGISTTTNNAARSAISILVDGSVQFNARRLDADVNTAITSSAGLCSAGGFYLITADHVCSTGAMRLWVDGVLVASGTAASTGAGYSATDSARFRIGQSVAGSGTYFTGSIRRPVMASKAISDADRATIETWVNRANLTANGYYLADGGRTMALNDPSMLLDGGRVLVGLARESSLPSRIVEFDLSTKRAKTVHVTTTTTTGGDDHDDAVTQKLADGSYIVGSVAHNSASFQIARGASMTALSEADIAGSLGVSNLSYCNIYQLEGEANDPIYIFGRGGSPWSARYSVSTDNGATWGAYTIWAENGANRPYVQYCKTSPTRIDFILTEGHPDTLATSIYHGYFEGGAFYKTDGTALGALPIDPTSFTKVFDGTATGGSWVWDLKRIGGELVAAFTSFPSTTAHRYHRAVLSGTSWAVETVVSDAGTNLYSGEPYYSGGLCLHPTNKDLLYCAVGPVGAHQLYPYTRDGGGTWSQGTALTSDSPRSFRPATVAGLLTFVRGTYTSYTNFPDCKIMGILI